MAELILILGGIRSGKSRLAESLLAGAAGVVFVATSGPSDAEMAERIADHRARRPASWQTVETADLAAAVRAAPAGSAVLIDSLGPWLAGRMGEHGLWTSQDVAPWGTEGGRARTAILAEIDALCAAAAARSGGPVVVVAEESGFGLVPMGASARRWLDLLGAAKYQLSVAASRVLLVVAGRVVEPQRLMPPGTHAAHGYRMAQPDALDFAVDVHGDGQPAHSRAVLDAALDKAGHHLDDAPALAALAAAIGPTCSAAAEQARRRHEGLAKPPGSLGRLERLGALLAAVAGRCPPPVPSQPAVIVACADHGVHAQGVTRWPQEITAAMTGLFCHGTATVNAIATTVGARVAVLDVGLAAAIPDHKDLRRARVRDGTADLSLEPAMTRQQATQAVLAGAALAQELLSGGADLLVPGDMGIANTTAAACLISVFTGAQPASVTGPGAGADDEMLALKRSVVSAALAMHRPDPSDPLAVLTAVGGLEHAALAGVILAAAARRVPVVLDGVNANAAALAATALQPHAGGYLIAGHRSTEPGAAVALAHLKLEPVLDLGLRLGEGTGGLLAVPIVIAAASVLTDVAEIAQLQTP